MTDRKHNCSANQVENTELQIGKLKITVCPIFSDSTSDIRTRWICCLTSLHRKTRITLLCGNTPSLSLQRARQQNLSNCLAFFGALFDLVVVIGISRKARVLASLLILPENISRSLNWNFWNGEPDLCRLTYSGYEYSRYFREFAPEL